MIILRKAWTAWKKVGQFIGDVLARVVLTLFYYTFFAPFGLGMRLWGDALQIKHGRQSTWLARTTRDLSLDDAKRLS